jgi:hypothetical protein
VDQEDRDGSRAADIGTSREIARTAVPVMPSSQQNPNTLSGNDLRQQLTPVWPAMFSMLYSIEKEFSFPKFLSP